MKPKSKLRAFLSLAGSTLLTITYTSAAPYYWDSNGDGTSGFGTAVGTWDAAGTGNLWSTSPTGDGVGGAAVADYATQAGDDLNFGVGGATPITYTGITTINGTVLATRVYQQSSHPAFVAGTAPKIDFGAAGIYETSNNNRGFPLGMEVTGTQLTWKSVRSLELMNLTSTVGKTILSTASEATVSYPGRVKMKTEANLGATNAPLVFDHGTLSLQNGFPYTSLSALHAAHPVSFVANKNAGLDNSTGLGGTSVTFTVDLPIDLGTGFFYTETSGGTASIIKLTSTSNNWSGIRMGSGIVEISDLAQLGPSSASLQFGVGTSELGNGTLRITGTSVTNLGTRPMLTTSGKGVSFDIADATNIFTVDQALNQGIGGFTKSGAGSLIINTTSTYTGLTTVSGGKLSFGTSAGLPTTTVTVNGADAVLDFEAYNPSVTTVTLQNGSVTGSGTLTGTSFVLSGNTPNIMTVGMKLVGAAATLAKSGTGTCTLSADNSGVGGAVTINGGVLNINSTTALGTGTVTLTSGTIDNTSGSAKTLTTNNLVTFNGNFTFGGSNNLTFGSGAITNAGSRTITLNGTNSVLTFGGSMASTANAAQTTTVNGAGNTLVLGGYVLQNLNTTNRINVINGSGDVTITGAVTNGLTADSGLTYSGTGTLTLQGNNTYTGNTTVNNGGCLALVGGSQNSAITVNSGAFLGLTLGQSTTSTKAVTLSAGHKVRIAGTPTPGTSYTLLTTSGTIGGTPVLETPLASHALVVEGTNTLVLKSLSTPFQDWALLKGLDGTPGKENGKTDDPDGDGKNNNFEFAFNGNPLSGSDNGMMAGLVQDASAPAGNELTLVVAVRDGATFANAGSPVVQTATKDGVTYTIEGSLDLVTIPGSAVSHASGPSDTAPVATGLPSLTGTAWEYHTFKLDASEGLGSKGFLRAKAE